MVSLAQYMNQYKEAFLRLPKGAKEAEVNAESHRVITAEVVHGAIEDLQVSESTEFFIRVSGERTGYAYTQNPLEDPDRLLWMAYENGACSDKAEPDCMNQEPVQRQLHMGQIPDHPDRIKAMALKLEEAIVKQMGTWSERLTVVVELHAETYGQHTVNSYGRDVCSYSPCYMISLSCQSAEIHVRSEILTAEPEGFDPEGIQIRCLVEDILRRLDYQTVKAEGFESGLQEVILSEAAAAQLFMTAWQEFSAAKYVDGACCLRGLLGKQAASELLTITDEPMPAEGGYPAYCDAEGTEGRSVTILERGRLVSLLSNQTAARTLQMTPSGNAGRRPLLFGNIATDILVTPKNFCIQPGTSTLSEMEANMGDGILITEYFDLFHSLDISSGNFSVPCYGVLIRGGKEMGTVFGMNLSGNFLELLTNVKAVGDTRQIHPMEFLKNYGIGTCALAVGKLNVSGE